MSAVTSANILFAERGAGRAADAAQDVVALLAQGRIAEAVETLDEVRRHVDKAQAELEGNDG